MSAEKVVIVGLGYVGLPVALAFAREFDSVLGFDISEARIRELRDGIDRTHEVERDALLASSIQFTSNHEEAADGTFFVVTVPTPIDANRNPDLRPLEMASKTVGGLLSEGDVVVFESTVYPGVTEEVCGPILAEVSGLTQGEGFKLGYSPERINPGDKTHRLENTIKIVAGDDEATLERVAKAYEAVVDAGVHRAPSIKVAEAAKVIENTQRDLNIALMNELALIFDRMGIRTHDVLAAAGTKWNFLRFTPGLVGGHCIGVDPYYLTAKAEALGYHPQMILAGRRINDGMGAFVAQAVIKLLIQQGKAIRGARVAILGLTFKENVPDLRNSRVPDIIRELRLFGLDPIVHDPRADENEAQHEYGLTLADEAQLTDLDGLILAVPHAEYASMPRTQLVSMLAKGGILADVKSMFDPADVPDRVVYWSL